MNVNNIILTLHNMCQFIPHVALIASAVTITILIILGQIDLLIIALVILIPLICVSLFLIINKKNILNTSIRGVDELSLNFKLTSSNLIKIYGILLFVTITWFALTQSRNLVLLILIVLLYMVIIVQIFTKLPPYKLIIIELILNTLLIILTKYLSYAYYFWSTDIHIFIKYISVLITSGNLPPSIITGIYDTFGTYIVYMGEATLLTNMAPLEIIHIIAPVGILSVSIVIVYYLAYHITDSKFISILSAFFYTLIPIVLSYTTYPVPRIYATLSCLIFLYLFLAKDNIPTTSKWIMGSIIIYYMTTVHHAQMLYIIPFITLICVGSLYWKKFSRDQKGLLALVYLIPISYWVYSFLSSGVKIIQTMLILKIESGEALETVTVMSDLTTIIMNNIASAILIIFVLSGLYFMLSRNNLKTKIGYLSIPLLLLILVFIPGVLDISSIMMNSLQIERLRALISPFFAIVMGIGCVVIIQAINRDNKNKKKGGLIVIFMCIILIIASPIMIQAKDSELFTTTTFTDDRYFDDGDLSMLQIITTYYSENSELITDYFISRYFPDSVDYSRYNQKYYAFTEELPDLFSKDHVINQGGYIIFRYGRYFSTELFADNKNSDSRTILKYNYDQYWTFVKNTFNMSIVFENGETSIFHNASPSTSFI